jgi:two-component system response regulator DctR
MTTAVPHVHIVDDDEDLRAALGFLVGSRALPWRGFGSAEAFLAAVEERWRGCILTDVRMSGLSGLELIRRLRDRNCRMPVIVLTGHGDVPMAVEALKSGADDFVQKPFDANQLVDKLVAAMETDARRFAAGDRSRAIAERVESLSAREAEVMELMLAGKLNKVIADQLGIAVRTVEVHRARVFEKMGVKSAVELATLLAPRGGVGQNG